MYALRMMKQSVSSDIQRWSLVQQADNIYIASTAKFRVIKPARIALGKNVTIDDYSIIETGPDPKAPNDGRKLGLFIGERSYLGQSNNVRAGGGYISIGCKCLISQQVTIVASNHGLLRSETILDQAWGTQKLNVDMGDDVWVGAGSIILPGVRIGTGAVIAANTVVNADVAEYAIVAGVPAREKGHRR